MQGSSRPRRILLNPRICMAASKGFGRGVQINSALPFGPRREGAINLFVVSTRRWHRHPSLRACGRALSWLRNCPAMAVSPDRPPSGLTALADGNGAYEGSEDFCLGRRVAGGVSQRAEIDELGPRVLFTLWKSLRSQRGVRDSLPSGKPVNPALIGHPALYQSIPTPPRRRHV